MNQAKRRIIAIALTAVIFLGFCAGMITVVAICGPHPLGWLAAAGAVFRLNWHRARHVWRNRSDGLGLVLGRA